MTDSEIRAESQPVPGEAIIPADLPFRVNPGTRVHLNELDPDDTGDVDGKKAAKKELKKLTQRIIGLQERLYAEDKQSLLVVLQATDTGGKDGAIRGVFSGVNPQGCRAWSFKAPSDEELSHDFLWRIHRRTPARGMISIFNRSQYEDVLIVRVKNLVPEQVWQKRFEQINEFEQMLTANRTTVLKFFLHISKDEQKERLQARLDDPDKHWKFSVGDLKERDLWNEYQVAFEDALSRCSTDYAPWFVIPANHKWFRNVAIARTVVKTLEAMNPQFPEVTEDLSGVAIPE